MAKQVSNDKVELCIYWDAAASAYKANAKCVISDTDLSKRKTLEVDLSSGTLQADVDAIAAAALAQVKSDEGIA